MTEIKFTDSAPITGMRQTSDGYMVGEVRCARTGCQTYRASELGLIDGGTVTVYRPEAAVFHKDSLATFAGKPVTMGHPAEQVTADNWRQHSVGDIGDEIARDGEFVKVPFRLMDAAAIAAVQDGNREVSMGYTTPITMQDGTAPDGTPYQAVQTGPIRINHLAIVAKARGGEQLRIGDSAKPWGAMPCPPTSNKKEDTMSDALKTVVLGDQAVQVAVADAGAIEKFKADAAKALTDAETAHAAAIAAKDEEIGTLKADAKKLTDAAMTPEKVSKLVADRVALEGTAKAIFADAKTDGVSDADLRKAVVAHKLGDDMVADASEGEIVGMFKAIAKDAAKADPFADGMKGGTVPKAGTNIADDAYAANVAHLQSAYRNSDPVKGA
ncbi:DUF2213 domain-containing protein [Oceaniglobus ichthyenteri]|uniref:DUF2213 domain-containing protein n=1 Tax=Oceaniglobus ichthyenteri TaxID=2136177 RepID=UPI000D396F14|nr:DUF2213 domain-containing protein [Oceaniglobus ichthyenteri]